MTCIAGLVSKPKVYIAADSLGAGNGCKQEYSTAKLIKLPVKMMTGEYTSSLVYMLIGYTSSYRMGDILKYQFEPPTIGLNQDINEYLVSSFVPELIDCFDKNFFTRAKDSAKSGGNFLLGLEGRLFHVQDDFSVLEPVNGYTAVGSGQEFAMGALYALENVTCAPEEALRDAIGAASQFSTTVGGKANIQFI
jgi:hypothetical protein